PKYAEAHNSLGGALCRKGEVDEGIACFRKAIKLDPKSAVAHFNLGNALRNQGKLDAALDEYREALRLEPAAADARKQLTVTLNKRAWILATDPDPRKRDPGRAVKLAREAVGLAPRNAGAWNILGAAHYRAGHWEAALAALQKSMDLRKGGDSFSWFF